MIHSACLAVHTASLQELLHTGVPISPHEAVAIVQQLLATISDPEVSKYERRKR